MLKVYYDAEFTGLHRNSTLISIGMISETGNTFYAQFTDYDQDQINDWIQENVLNNLKFWEGETHYHCKAGFTSPHNNLTGYHIQMENSSDEILHELLKWLESERMITVKSDVQFMVDCYAYDWMLLVDLITKGQGAIEMPEYIHYIPIDLSTALWSDGVDPDITREVYVAKWLGDCGQAGTVDKHNALWDARVIKACFDRLSDEALTRRLAEETPS